MPINHPRRGTHPYYHYQSRRFEEKPKKKRWPTIFFIILVLLIFCGYLYMRPVNAVQPTQKSFSDPTFSQVNTNWSGEGQAAFGTIEQGVLATKPNQAVKPTASTAKLITALTVLDKKPLKIGEQGSIITLGEKDKKIYDEYYQKDGSIVEIKLGEKLTQYQMLQGLLLPSANNYADSLALWTFGDLKTYQKAAQKKVDSLGLKNTTVGSDASGFSPDTKSTSEDLTRLAIAAIKHPVIKEIVKQEQVDLPVAGVKLNTNWLLGLDGVVGVKTGHTTEAGGVYTFASEYKVDSKNKVTIVGTVQGEKNVIAAIRQARTLLASLKPNFAVQTILPKGTVVASYNSAWGEGVEAVVKENLNVAKWKGSQAKPKINLYDIEASAKKGSIVGKAKYLDKSVDIILKDDLGEPPLQWRVFRGI